MLGILNNFKQMHICFCSLMSNMALIYFILLFGLTLVNSHTMYQYQYYPGGYNIERQSFQTFNHRTEYPQSIDMQEQIHMKPSIQLQSNQIRCCIVQKCVGRNCHATFTCGNSCPKTEMTNGPSQLPNPMPSIEPPNQMSTVPVGSNSNYINPNTQTCCRIEQCNSNGCRNSYLCGDECSPDNLNAKPLAIPDPLSPNNKNPNDPSNTPEYEGLPGIYLENSHSQTSQTTEKTTPSTNTSKKPQTLPGRLPPPNSKNENEPETQTIPGITLESEKPKNSKTTKKPEQKPQVSCKDDGAVKYPDEEMEDYGPTPGFYRKKSYTYNKCNSGSCEPVEKKCGTCPDPFEPGFKLYNVKKSCFLCYEISS